MKLNEGITPLGPSIAKTSFDSVPFDASRKIGEVADGELATAVEKAGQANAHENGRTRNAELWANHIATIRKEAGDLAVTQAFGAN